MASFQLPTQQASLFGKLPTVLDYVRINHSYPPAIALDEWMSRALQDLTVASLSWPAARYRFLFAPSGLDHALVGVFGPSRDRAGRKFPLSVFVPVPVSAIARKFAALPAACEALFGAADALLDDAAKLSRDDAAERLLSIPRLDPDALEDAYAGLQVALDERTTESFVRGLYGGADYEADEAFARATASLSKVRSAPPERALSLDCPVASAGDVSAWLSLAEVCLGWSRDAPSLFWSTDSEPGRLVISLGTPLPTLPLWLADRKRKSDRLVSLHSPNAASASSSAPPASGSAYAAPASGSAYAAPASGSAYAAPASGSAYAAPASGSAYAAPASGSAYAAPASGSAYAAPASGSAYAAPASGSAYAAPAPAPSAPLPTPARAPLPTLGAATPPQGFAITARLPEANAGTDPTPSVISTDEVETDASSPAVLDAVPPDPVEALASAREQNYDASPAYEDTPPPEPGAAPEAGEDLETSRTQERTHTRQEAPAKHGPSLWRKWRALAAAG